VVDNGSTSPPNAVVGRHTGARLLHEKQPGPGPARNTGIQHAAGEVLALIDADCRAHPDWLRNALLALQSSPDGTILGGDVRIWRDDGKAFTAIEAYESVFAYRFKLYIEQHGFSGTGNLVVHREDFEKVGPFAGIDFAEDHGLGTTRAQCGISVPLRSRHDCFSSGTSHAARIICEMGSPDTALHEYGAGEARMESSMDLSRCGGSRITGHRLREGNRQRPDRRRGGPLQGDHNPYRDPHSSRTKNAQSAAGKQDGSLES